jgi:hypothetical protein
MQTIMAHICDGFNYFGQPSDRSYVNVAGGDLRTFNVAMRLGRCKCVEH